MWVGAWEGRLKGCTGRLNAYVDRGRRPERGATKKEGRAGTRMVGELDVGGRDKRSWLTIVTRDGALGQARTTASGK